MYKRQPDDCADKVLDILHGTAGYNGTPLFKDIEMHIKKGETVGLIGPNGCLLYTSRCV